MYVVRKSKGRAGECFTAVKGSTSGMGGKKPVHEESKDGLGGIYL